MRTALLIAAKDLRQRIRDRSALLTSIVAPLGLAVIFAGLLGGALDFHATYVVADLDGGRLAVALRTEVIGGMADAGAATVTDAPTEADARTAVAEGKADTAFIIPAGFSAAIESGKSATLVLVGARTSGLETQVAAALAQRFGDGVGTAQLAVAAVTGLKGGAMDAATTALVVQQATTMPPPVELVDTTAPLRQLSLPTYFAASMAILFLFFSATFGIVSLFEERRNGTLARVLAGPVRPGAVLIGKTLAGFVAGLAALAVLVVATTVLIKADWGSPLGVALLALGATTASTGISILVASFCRTAEAAGAATSAIAITLGVLGGTFSPTAQAPEIMTTIALLTPHGWFMRGLGDLHGTGATWADALVAVGVLLAIGLVTGLIGLARSRRLVTVA